MTKTGIGARLETVSAVCESPELSLVDPPNPDLTLQQLMDSLTDKLHLPQLLASLLGEAGG